jgi:hypothetical protein
MEPSSSNAPSLAESGGQAADLGFTWRVRKSGEVDVLRRGRVAVTLRGALAAEFLAEAGAGSAAAQQAMARLTGNYKRGNERLASKHPRNRR